MPPRWQATPARSRSTTAYGNSYLPCHATPYLSKVANVTTAGRTNNVTIPSVSAHLPRRPDARNPTTNKAITSVPYAA